MTHSVSQSVLRTVQVTAFMYSSSCKVVFVTRVTASEIIGPLAGGGVKSLVESV